MSTFERVASLSDMPASGRLSVEFDDRAVLVLRIGNDYYGIEDVCSHDGQPLTDGPLRDTSISSHNNCTACSPLIVLTRAYRSGAFRRGCPTIFLPGMKTVARSGQGLAMRVLSLS